jgi:pre-mRNA-processing factor 17
MSATERNHWAGRAENAHLSSYAFDEEYHTFQATGRAMDPGVSGREVAAKDDNAQGDTQHVGGPHKRQRTTESRSKESIHPSRSVDPSAPFTLRTRQPWAEKASLPVQLTEEQAEAAAAIAEERAEKAAVQGRGEHSIFHGGAERDYQGRSWLEVPVGAHRAAAEASFLPKRHLHTWSGHTKGVNAVRFFPGTGHLLLSAGLDGKIKVWDTAGDRRCMRTYLGHTKGVRDAWFSADGRRFVSAAYDKTIKVWDTETGAVLAKLGDGQMAYCVRTHPDPGQDDVLLAGMQSRKILQFDMRTADVVQEYDYHLSAVNTVTFVDENRRFISTSGEILDFALLVILSYMICAFGFYADAKALNLSRIARIPVQCLR